MSEQWTKNHQYLGSLLFMTVVQPDCVLRYLKWLDDLPYFLHFNNHRIAVRTCAACSNIYLLLTAPCSWPCGGASSWPLDLKPRLLMSRATGRRAVAMSSAYLMRERSQLYFTTPEGVIVITHVCVLACLSQR